MVTQRSFFGWSEDSTISANKVLSPRMPRLQFVTPTTSGLSCNLGNARNFQLGGPHFWVINAGPDTLAIKNNSGTTLVTLNANEVAEIYLIENTATAGTWRTRVRTVGFSDTVAANYYHYFSGGDYRTSQFVSVVNRTTEYNQVLDIYTQKTNTTLTHGNGASFGYGTTIHQSGGSNNNSGHVQYDPDTWTSQTALTAGHENHAGCELTANLGAVFGGSTSGGDGTFATRVRTDTFASAAWTSRTARPGVGGSNRNPAVSIAFEALLLGGFNSLEIHNYSVDTWITKTSRPLPAIEGQAAFSDGTNAYLFGGSAYSTVGRSVLGLKFDKTMDSWSTIVSLPEGRVEASGSYIAPHGMIFGGNTDSDFLRGCAYRYEPATDTLTKMTDINFWGWTEGQCHAQPCLR